MNPRNFSYQTFRSRREEKRKFATADTASGAQIAEQWRNLNWLGHLIMYRSWLLLRAKSAQLTDSSA